VFTGKFSGVGVEIMQIYFPLVLMTLAGLLFLAFIVSENLRGLEKVKILKKLHNLRNLHKLKKLSTGAACSGVA
jgi:hypothetical protein